MEEIFYLFQHLNKVNSWIFVQIQHTDVVNLGNLIFIDGHRSAKNSHHVLLHITWLVFERHLGSTSLLNRLSNSESVSRLRVNYLFEQQNASSSYLFLTYFSLFFLEVLQVSCSPQSPRLAELRTRENDDNIIEHNAVDSDRGKLV